MPKTSLPQLFSEHSGYLADKWEQYLGIYEAELSPLVSAGRPIRLLQIGVQNGGSLQLWAKYLPQGSQIIGIDIDGKCAELSFDESVRVLIGDACDGKFIEENLTGASFDVIIDDGSHRAADVIKAFTLLFPKLAAAGKYFIEDLQASYRNAYGGGFRDPESSVEWLKRLVDAIHLDHIDEKAALGPQERRLLKRLNEQIERLAFYDSLAVVEKYARKKRRRFARVLSGSNFDVTGAEQVGRALKAEQAEVILSRGAFEVFDKQEIDRLTKRLSEQRQIRLEVKALQERLVELGARKREISALIRERDLLRRQLQARTEEIDKFVRSVSWRVTKPLRLANRVLGTRAHRLSQLGSWLRHRRFDLLRTYLALRFSRKFDAASYARAYHDVSAQGISPLMHYVTHGMREGRSVRPKKGASERARGPHRVTRPKLSRFRRSLDVVAAPWLTKPSFAEISPTITAVDGVYEESSAHRADTPRKRVSVIVLNRDGEPLLDRFLSSLAGCAGEQELEIIVVDHASRDRSAEAVERWSTHLSIIYVQADDNYTFSYSNNRAAEIASGEYLLFLNNDVFVTPNSISRLLALIQDESVGAVGIRLQDVPAGNREISAEGAQHIGIRFPNWDLGQRFLRPQNVYPSPTDGALATSPARFTAVTAAMLLCRRREFLALGGFCEDYVFGYEDVDFCQKLRTQLGKDVLSANDSYAIHADAWSRSTVDSSLSLASRRSNAAALWRRFGYLLRRETNSRLLFDDGSWTGRRPTVAFAVTDIRPDTPAGDLYTAQELGSALASAFGWKIRFLPRKHWYDVGDADVVVAMTHHFDPARVRSERPDLIKVAYMRNWFDAWAKRDHFLDFDLYFASSEESRRFVEKTAGVVVGLLPLATNPERFPARSAETPYRFDYVFTGNYWGVERDLSSWLDPRKSILSGAVYGNGWKALSKWKKIRQGFAPYEQLPEIYRSAKIVVDDANSATKQWGSVNSRVFDALASGTLVITNGRLGSDEVFDGRLPVYDGPESLNELLERYARDDGARLSLVRDLQACVLESHTYPHRAMGFREALDDFRSRKLRFAIKVPAPSHEIVQEWGDYHLACSLRRALKRRGHSVRIDILPDWERDEGVADDVVIVLRGLSRYQPQEGQINLLWQISHPEKLEPEECDLFDHVFVASLPYAEKLRTHVSVPVTPLLQFTDPAVFYPPGRSESGDDILFVGNTRKQDRIAVRYAVGKGLPVSVYGSGWDDYIPERFIRNEHIPYAELHETYGNAAIVLNDHWPEMAEEGFISNRIFDVAASGGFVLSDEVEGARDVFGDALEIYRSADELAEKARHFLANPDERKRKADALRAIVIDRHTVEDRIEALLEVVERLHERSMCGATDAALPNRAGVSPRFDASDRCEGAGFGLTEWAYDDSTPATIRAQRTPESWSEEARRRSLFHPPGAPRLHVACGPSAIIEGWWNVDIRPFPGVDEQLDATALWPYPDGSLDYVYAEHFIEHLEVNDALAFLEEAHRCLKPDGRIRLSTPSLEWVLTSHYAPEAEPARQIVDTLETNRAFRGRGHRFLYSREMLNQVLGQCGFAQIEYREYGESEDENLRNLEKHDGYTREGEYPSIWIVEAVRSIDAIPPSDGLRETLDRYVRDGRR